MYGNTICSWCGNEIEMTEALHPYTYYREKAREIYHPNDNHFVTDEEEHIILLEEARRNPQFDEELAKECFKKWEENCRKASENDVDRFLEKRKQAHVPKCPTCGSTDVVKISDLKRGVHAVAFGIFSKTAFSQYKCKNCGYKW